MSREPNRFISTTARDGEAVQFLNELFEHAATIGASDVHVENQDDGATIRLRVAGNLQDYAKISDDFQREIDTKVRYQAKLPLHEFISPLDGRIHIKCGERHIDLRINLLPTRTGQSIVFRLLDQANATRDLDDIDMPDEMRAALAIILRRPNGLFLVSGPTGSGKTSTLYSLLNRLNVSNRKIVTVEDPVEYRLPGACQVDVEAKRTFPAALRAVLRQDPDIILIGEIRDTETARIAVEAALTGHLVLSTIHANDATATITRLTDLGVNPFALATALRGVMAQRLLPRLCTCHTTKAATAQQKQWLASEQWHDVEQSFGEACGCEACNGTGWKGRVPVFEMITNAKDVRAGIEAGEQQQILAAAREQHQFQALAVAATQLAADGKTSLTEAFLMSLDDHDIAACPESAAA